MRPDTLVVDLLQLAANYSYGVEVRSLNASKNSMQLISYDKAWGKLMGNNVIATIKDERDYQFVHEAGVKVPSTGDIYAVSNYAGLENPINVTVIDGKTFKAKAEAPYPNLRQPNGADLYNDTHLVFAVFGDFEIPSTLNLVEPKTKKSTVLLSSYYGRNFNGLNDVRVKHDDGTIWFTDDWYGQLQGFKPPVDIPNQIYRFDPKTGHVKAVADGFTQPNGIEFSPDYKTLYMADSGYVLTPHDTNGTRPSTIYEFDIAKNGALTNRRVFTYSSNPFVDGVHADKNGNIWSTSGDGITAWNRDGVLLGEIRVDTAVNNFLFVDEGILLLAFTKIWLIQCDVRPKSP